MSTESQTPSAEQASPTPTSSPTPTYSAEFFSEAPLLALLELSGPTMDKMSDAELEAAVTVLRSRREQRVLSAKLKEPQGAAGSKPKRTTAEKAGSDLLKAIGL